MRRSLFLPVMGWGTLAFLYLPLLVLVAFSFNASRFGAAWTGFTWDWYAKLLADRKIMASTWNSTVVAAVSTALATVLGTLAAVARGREATPARKAKDAFFYVPLLIPELMLAVGFLLFFGLFKADLGLLALIVAHTTLNVPIVWLIVKARLEKIDPRLEDAAVDLGATRWQALRKVTLPLLMPAIAAGALMAFVISIDCFLISFFVAGPSTTTLPIQIYSMLKFAISPEVNALSTLLFLASLVLVVAAWLLQGGEDASSH
ncbi:MAG: ABC transporter permease [Elusimicrobia bacterium]|nr:ABC transporter permease [Elusimicrobiota bacterium]